MVPLHPTLDTSAHSSKADKRQNDKQIERDDGLVLVAVTLEALCPDIALEAGAHVVVGMLELGALAHFKPLVEAELTRARAARLGRIDGRVERHERRIGLEARTLAQMQMAAVLARCHHLTRIEDVGGGVERGEWSRRRGERRADEREQERKEREQRQGCCGEKCAAGRA